ncbi:MAG: DUF695 domain-containing protein [Muribaculaceae bacterium]|nr:DUF695 domain-containing protein [Muribaculaceae bacterium]
MKGEWWTCPTVSESGKTVIVTGREDINKFRDNPRFNVRVEVSWEYDGNATHGMPDVETSMMMETVTDRLTEVFDKDPVAVLTGIYTGDGRRDWIFYTLSTNIFGRKLNEALTDLPVLPLSIYCENDSEWNEYQEMKDNSYIE